jgi:DNA invertase Pin-like site-specific DNA recombinase
MRVVVYARYSSENQREASIEDQIRLCRARIERESGWTYVTAYTDYAVSGSVRMRPGYQRLLEDARRGEFDIVLAEALDRLSRDQEDVAALYKHLSFAGVKMVTLGEGEVTELHVGLKGTMNALFLKDLAKKTWRGLEGRVREGRSGGGLCYGYDVLRELDGRGEPIHGGRRVNEAQAAIVRRIFEEFAGGRSPRAIAMALNRDEAQGPHGKAWGPSTIYGNWRRGTGVLNNELYIGKLVWNRQRFLKDPHSGKRVARMNPRDEWIVQEVPELRIIDDALWEAVKVRQSETRHDLTHDAAGIRSERARRPAYLLSNLLTCASCGGGFSKVSNEHYGCSNARNRGTCSNRLTIRRDVVEASVLSGLRTHLMEPELVQEFVAEYHRELNRLNATRGAEHRQQKDELARVERQIRSIIEAIKDGLRTAGMKEELLVLEARKEELARRVKHAPPPAALLHPNLAALYREKVDRLHEELNREELRAEAAEAIRELIDEVRLVPENGRLEIELTGDLAGILALAAGSKKPATGGRDRLQVTLVAGTRNHRQLEIEVVV